MSGESGSPPPTVVSGVISFEGGVPRFAAATIYVRLEDVSVLDSPSVVLSQQVLQDVRPPDGGRGVPFRVDAGAVDPARRCNLRVHVDVDGDGRVSAGDFVTVQSYPVTPGHRTELRVVVRSV
jgi:uncharacterized lipoprotein YbaY